MSINQKFGAGLALFCMGIAWPGAAVVAKEADADPRAESGKTEGVSVYKPEFFASYFPVTALDMVRQVPGFSINNGDNVRGFGGAQGNVLIDGERPSTKSDNLASILQRISADRVDHIELIRGSAPDIDMRGLTRVLNVVLKTDDTADRNNWSYETTLSRSRVVVNGEFVRNLTLGGADITLGIARQGGPGRSTGIENRFSPPGTLTERRDEAAQRNFAFWTPTFNLEKKFAGDRVLRLNAKGNRTAFTRNEFSFVETPTVGAFSFLRFDGNTARSVSESTEFGGDYSFPIGKKLDVKLIGLRNDNTSKGQFSFASINATGQTNASRVTTRDVTSESISRIVVDWGLSKKHSLQFTAEGALNTLDANLLLELDNGNGFSVVPLPVSNTGVKERRAEFSASWVYVPNQKWTIESGLKFETSRLSQSGDASRTRNFSFPKPSLTASYNLSEKNQLRFSAIRKVAQLNFKDFVTSVNLTDDLTDVGNPELEPDRTWTVKAEWERRFAKKGSLTLSANRDWITQVQGRVPVNNIFDAPGNLGDARLWQVKMVARLPLDMLGLKNATLDANGFISDSSVTDPVTGVRRKLGSRAHRNFDLSFRQDLSAQRIAWGWAYNNGVTRRSFRLFEEQVRHLGGGNFGGGSPRAFSVFVETTKIAGMTAIFDIRNIFNRPSSRVRTFYDGPRSDGIVAAIESQQRKSGLRYRIQLRGSF
ncbi:MAG: outer membrane beta-barrel protein [Robiginitomaculum sp.]|nr:outer membrane beta-barrel protein [Robiginitomaculum sp.]MDQ7077625.1 outer membrane beta-barrel protein [Robiginitomaculum sp.]